MVRVGLAMLLLTGCARMLGLEPPTQQDAGAASRDAAGGTTDATTADAASTQPGACPTNYVTPSGATSRYRYGAVPAPWLTAAQDCADDATTTHLVVIGSETERELVLNTVTMSNGFWTGLSDRRSEGTYRWVTVEPVAYPPATSPPWGPGEPSTEAANDCAVAEMGSGVFSMETCGAAFRYVCECDAYKDEATHYQP